MIIEKVTHDSWENQVTRRIIKPLGLRHTYAPGTSTRLPRPHATGSNVEDPQLAAEYGLVDHVMCHDGY